MVPKQLQSFKFCKILKGTKKPFEKDWTNKNYSYNQISEWVGEENNYGVVCGNGLIVIDSDTKKLKELVENKLPKTFRVLTGSGGTHDYYICPELKNKIILQIGDEHYGEIQSTGTQVVGAGSLHPNGRKYEIVNDVEIVKLELDKLIEVIKPYMREVKSAENRVKSEIKDYGNSDINTINITDVISTSGFKKASNGELFGPNPWHGSNTGMNFWINPTKNVAHCFRCNVGLNVAKIIALENNIISSCGDYLSRDDFLKVLNKGYEKYGLEKKESIVEVGGVFEDKLIHARKFYELQPIYYDESGIWWLWDSNKFMWLRIDEVELLNQIYKNLHLDIITPQKRSMILNSLKQVGRDKRPEKIKNTWIQFKDKIIDIEDGNKIKASSKYFITNPIPWKIGESEETPTMDKIFEEWVGKDYIQTLYEVIAYCTLPDYPIHRLFCFMGEGLNGKSKFLELITKFISIDNSCSTELDVLLNSRFEMTRLHKKLMCEMGETNFAEMSKTAMLKKLTGQDLIGYEYKNKDLFHDYNYAKILISTNNIPTTTDKTVGFYRRWMIIDFPNRFSEKKNILKDIPEIEYNNLAMKCIRILKELLKKREFTNEGTIDERIKNFEDKSNPFDKFMKEMIKEDYDSHIFKYDFRKKLDDWCKDNRFRKLSDTFIGKKMKEMNIETHKLSTEWYNKEGEKPRLNAWVGMKWKQ